MKNAMRCAIVLLAIGRLCAQSSTVQPSIPCVGTPGNTAGAPGQLCKTTAGALYVCNVVSPASCAVAADWVNPAVPFLQNGAGAVTRTVQSKITEIGRASCR